MFSIRLRRRTVLRRFAVVLVAVLGVSALRSATPAPEAASGVTDPVTGERIGELTYGITPARLFDTRPGAPTADGTFSGWDRLEKDTDDVLTVRGRGGVPAAATGVYVNMTVSGSDGAGYLSAWPEGGWPGTSNVNFAKGETIANFAFVALGSDGSIRLRVADTKAHVIVDAVAFTSDLPTITG